MRIIKGIKNITPPRNGSVVTIGVFDGVHIGHARVIRETVRRARERGMKSVVVTFDPHPMKFLRHGLASPSLISLDHRIRLIEELGVDMVAVIRFSSPIAKLSPGDFLSRVILKRLNARCICVSDKFRFGSSASGDVGELRKLSSGFGFEAVVIPSVRISGEVVSSSGIRKLITSGNMSAASKALGRPVSVYGTVVAGARIARGLGYPTANLNPHHEVVPPSGVYAVRVSLNGKVYGGVLNIGRKPTFYSPRDIEPLVEVHIFRFNKNIYGKDLEVSFIKKLRDERKFDSREALIRQIARDVQQARRVAI